MSFSNPPSVRRPFGKYSPVKAPAKAPAKATADRSAEGQPDRSGPSVNETSSAAVSPVDRSALGSTLRCATDLYVSRQSHDPHEKALYRELAISSLDSVSLEDRRQIAFQLIRHPDAPQDVLARLAADADPTTAYPVLRNALHIATEILLAQAVRGPDSLRRAILARPDVDLDVLDAIATHGGVDAVRELLQHPRFTLDEATVRRLCARREILPAIGSQLAARGVLSSQQMMGSFLSLSSDLRMEALASAELTALVALARNGGRKPSRPDVPADILQELEQSALSGPPEAFPQGLSRATGLSPATTSAMINGDSGEALAVALKGVGVGAASAGRIFVRLLGTHLSLEEIRGLSNLYNSLSEGAALALIDRWIAAENPGPEQGQTQHQSQYQGQYQETRAPRSRRTVTGDTIWQDLDDIERLLRIG